MEHQLVLGLLLLQALGGHTFLMDEAGTGLNLKGLVLGAGLGFSGLLECGGLELTTSSLGKGGFSLQGGGLLA